MPDSIQVVLNYLIFIKLHPMVVLVVLLIIAIGKQRWEEPHVILVKQAIADAAQATPEQATVLVQTKKDEQAKADRIGNIVVLIGWAASVLGQFAFYGPRTGQDISICVFMSLGEIGVAYMGYLAADKWGIADRLGTFVQKKIDQKTAG